MGGGDCTCTYCKNKNKYIPITGILYKSSDISKIKSSLELSVLLLHLFDILPSGAVLTLICLPEALTS
jgi:hypothetical protein